MEREFEGEEKILPASGGRGEIKCINTMLEIKQNEPLKNHSTFRIGGPARYFAVAKSREEILEAMEFAKKKNLPYFVFGGGSNILFRDEGYNGVAIKSQISNLKSQNLVITAGSGILLSQVINFAVENNLTGLEWGIGIPGTVGGCVAGNCGAYGYDISESIEKVITLDKEYSKEQCEFCYRGSRFKKLENKEIILEVELKLQKGAQERSREGIKNILNQRKNKIPSYPSIGCIFKNLKNQNSNLKSISAGSLIEQCGLKGKRIGDAQISEIHANFIINVEKATAKDVLKLIKLCKEKVKEKFNVGLEEEIVVL